MTHAKKMCSGCYWNDSCDFAQPCSHYTPCTNDLSNCDINDLIERKRNEYYQEWDELMQELEEIS